MASPATAAPKNLARKAYQPPTLTVFGPLSKLTQNGTGGTKENNGKSTCGLSFAKAGGSGC